MKECVDNLNQEDDKEKLVSSLWGAERCLRVLESVSVTDFREVWESLKSKPDQTIKHNFCVTTAVPMMVATHLLCAFFSNSMLMC